MTGRISVEQARATFDDLLGSVCTGLDPVIVERDGKPLAVLIGPKQFERYQKHVMERFAQTLNELHRLNADTNPDEVQRDIDEAVEEVRRERYEQRHRQAGQDSALH